MKFALFSGSTPLWTPNELSRNLAAQKWDGVEWRIVDQKPAETPGFWAGNRATFPFTGVEHHIGEIVAATVGAGLAFAGLAGYVPISERENVDRLLAATSAAGAGQARIAIPKVIAGVHYDVQFAEARADMAHAADSARRHGVKALIQIHHGNIISSSSAARRLLEGLDSRAVGVIHDLGNLSIEGREGLGTYTPGLEILGDYLAHIHVKNAVWSPSAPQPDGTVDWSWQWASLASGVGDVPAYFRSLKAVDYDGWVTVENFLTEGTQEQRLAEDLAYLRAQAIAAGYSV